MILKISEVFSDEIGGVDEGIKFRNLLLTYLAETTKQNKTLLIDLDDTFGYNDAFLKTSFQSLNQYKGFIKFKSLDELGLIQRIERIMEK